MVTRAEFAEKLLRKLHAPVTMRNQWALVSWMTAEGGTAHYNPLNTTQKMPGSWDYNWVPVQNYPDLETGLEATVKTLNYGADRGLYGYHAIRHNLRRNAWARRTLGAVERSAWGTGGLALRVLPYAKRNFESYANRPVGH